MFRYLPLLALLFASQSWAITYRAIADDGASAGTEATVSVPSGTVEDDIMLAFCAAGDATVDATDWTVNGGGWTELDDFLETNGFDRRVAVFYRVASGSEPASYTFDHGAAGTDRVQCAILSYDVPDTTTPIDVTYVRASHYGEVQNTAESQDPPSITTVTDDAFVVLMQYISHDDLTAGAPPTGYTERAEVNFGVSHRQMYFADKEVTTAGAEDPGAFGHTENATGVNEGSVFVIAIRPESTGPVLSGTGNAAAANGFTVSGTLTGSGTLTAYAVGVAPADGTPTCTQIKAGQNDAGTSAALSGSEVWTTGVSNDFTITDANAWVRYDVHMCGSDGTTDTNVVSFTDQNRSEDTNEQVVVLAAPSETGMFGVPTDTTADTTLDSNCLTDVTDWSLFGEGYEVTVSSGFSCSPYCAVESVSSGQVCLDETATSTVANVTLTKRSYFDPTVASADVIELDDNTSGACAITFETDGDFSWAGCTGAEEFDYCVQDASNTSVGNFTTPNCWTTDATWYVNNTPPVLDASGSDEDIVVVTPPSTAMDSIDYTAFCSDADGHTVALDYVRGTIPPGLSLTSGVLSGTPTTENESGAQMTMRCTDDGGLVSYEQHTIYPITTITLPDYTGQTVAAANSDIQTTDFKWRVSDPGTTQVTECSNSVASGLIISTDPVPTTEVTAFEVIEFNVSTGACPIIGGGAGSILKHRVR